MPWGYMWKPAEVLAVVQSLEHRNCWLWRKNSCPERRDYFAGKHLRHRGVDEPRGSGSRGKGRGPRVKRTYEFTVGEVHIRERLQG